MRSTVERLQERVRELEAENASLKAQVGDYAEDRDALISQRQVLMDSERALSTRLKHLDTLAREIVARVDAMNTVLDK